MLPNRDLFRKSISWAFALVSLIAAAVFNQAISAFVAKKGWDQAFIAGWRLIAELGWEPIVAFSFFALGGATIALWIEMWFRDQQNAKAQKDRKAEFCVAKFTFEKSSGDEFSVRLNNESENVRYFAWYLNNGGTLHNQAVMIFIEFEKEISLPEVFAHSILSERQWRQIACTDRFIFVELEGWPDGDVVLQAFDSIKLGLVRRSELKVWRPYGPPDA